MGLRITVAVIIMQGQTARDVKKILMEVTGKHSSRGRKIGFYTSSAIPESPTNPEDQRIPVNALIDMWMELYKLDEEPYVVAKIQELSNRNLADLVVTRLGSCIELLELPHTIGGLNNLNILDISECLEIERLLEEIGGVQNLSMLQKDELERLG
ncbi:unnamed protein product [Dovyalis caffra]|uniref:Disease resistance protein n=1 Tax=Dovyalis caffra TaxID=77055 RepID=A0AAV1S6X2_9ROSI|nr:unnamed protein product [Dovyalis caffra]